MGKIRKKNVSLPQVGIQCVYWITDAYEAVYLIQSESPKQAYDFVERHIDELIPDWRIARDMTLEESDNEYERKAG